MMGNKMHSKQGTLNGMLAVAVGAALIAAGSLAPVTPASAQGPPQPQQDSRVNSQDAQDTGRIKQNAPKESKDKEPKHTVSKALGKPLKAAQDAMTAKKYPEAIAKLKEAEAISGKTPWDEHLINEMYGYTYAHTNDFPDAAKAYEATLSDGFVDPADVPGRVRLLAQMYYQLKNYDKAIDFGTRAIKGGFDNEEIQTIVGQAYYLKNDYKGTIKFVDSWIDSSLKKGQTPKEQTINLVLSSCVKLEEAECTSKSLEAVLNSQFVPQSEVADRTRTLMLINYQLKNYDKAIDFGQRAVKGGFANDDMYKFTSQAYFLKNDFKSVKSFTEPYVEMEVKNGRTPTEEILQILLNSCSKLNDDECVTKQLERLVTYHPKNEYWQNLLYSMFQAPSMNDKTLLNTFRLANEVDVLKKPDDFTEMAQLAIEQGSPGEAQHVLEKGFQRNIFPDARTQDKNKRLLASAQKAAEQDLAQLPKIAADADGAPTGDKNVGVGLAYLGYQQYDKASDALSKGLSKGGLKNEAEAHLLLGIAQLKGGHKDDAVKSFKAVKGDPNLERIATLWSLHAKQA